MASTSFSNGTVIQATWLNDVNKATYTIETNVLGSDSGAVADGTGTGGGTDNATAFGLAVDGGNKRVMVPPGTYRLDSGVTLEENTELYLAHGAVLDFTNSSTGISVTGTLGTEINTSVAVTSGDTTVQTTSAHGLVAGDWFLLWSQRAALHADAGTTWRLGETTSGTTSTYFAEPCLVKSVTNTTTVVVTSPIIFPDYNTSNASETYAGPRSRTTIAKLNLVNGIKISGNGKIIAPPGGHAVNLTFCFEPEVKLKEVYLGTSTGSAVRMASCLRGKVKAKAKRDPTWSLVSDHSAYNSFRDVGSWWSDWDYKDYNGSQGLDVSWSSDKWPSILPTITGASFDSHEDGLNIHSGCFGGLIKNFRSYRAVGSGIVCASRFVRIETPYILGPNVSSVGGIVLTAWGCVDGGIYGGKIKDITSGYGVDVRRTGEVDVGPAYKNMDININIDNCLTGIYLRQASSSPETTSESGIRIDSNIRNTAGKAIQIDGYVNYVTIKGTIGAVTSGTSAIYMAADAVGLHVPSLHAENIGSGVSLLTLNSISDTTTWPSATYKSNRCRINLPGIRLVGTGNILSGSYQVNTSADYTVVLEDADTLIRIGAATGKTLTIPAESSVNFPVGTVISAMQMSSADVTVAGAVGVTVNSRNGLKTNGQYAVIFLRKYGSDTWVMYGDTKV